MKGGILSRALAGSRSFNGGYSSVYSGASKSNFRVTSTQAAKLYYVAFDGKLQQPDQEPIINANRLQRPHILPARSVDSFSTLIDLYRQRFLLHLRG